MEHKYIAQAFNYWSQFVVQSINLIVVLRSKINIAELVIAVITELHNETACLCAR